MRSEFCAARTLTCICFLRVTGRHTSDLEVQIRNADLTVTLLGNRTDVGDLLAACDVFVLPSRFEGFPLSLLEAMAAERAIVATANWRHDGGISRFQADGEQPCAWTVPPDNLDRLASALAAALDDPEERSRRASAAAKRFDHHFAAAPMGEAMAALYAATLASAHLPTRFPEHLP